MTIIRRARDSAAPPIIRYRDARPAIVTYLADDLRSVNPLVQAESLLRERADQASETTFRQEDARLSIEVLHAIQRMANQLAAYTFRPAPDRQGKLALSGVEVSVRADLMVHGTARGVPQIGAAVLRLTQDDADTGAARARRREMGLYVATLARLHLDRNIRTERTPANRLCLSIDVQHGEAFAAPASNSRRMNDLDNACRVIAALWDQV